MTDAPETDASLLAPVSGACVRGIRLGLLHIFVVITLPVRAVAKYCDECVCLSVCPSVRPSVRPSLSVRPSVCLSVRQPISRTTSAIFTKFFVHVAYVHGSVLLRHVYDRLHCLLPGRNFLPHWQCTITHLLQRGSFDCQ